MTRALLAFAAVAVASAFPGAGGVSAGPRCLRHISWPAFSANGHWISYERTQPTVVSPPDCPSRLVAEAVSTGGDRRLISADAGTVAWSPRGETFAFFAGPGPPYSLVVGTPRRAHRLPHVAGSDLFLRWAPDGATLAASVDGKLFLVDARTRATHRVAEDTTAYSWSPRGSQLVFDDGDELVVTDRNGVERRKIAEVDLYRAGLRWSPHGDWIAFETFLQPDPWQVDLRLVRPDGSELHRLDDCGSPVWSPAGDRLAVQHCFGGSLSEAEIHIASVDGSRHLPAGHGGALWSPTGRYLVTISGLFQPGCHVRTLEGVVLRSFAGRNCPQAWSPRRDLVLVSDRWQEGPLFVLDPARRELERLGRGHDAVWSPGGRRIAYARTVKGCGDELVVMKLSTRRRHVLVPCRA